MDRSRIVRIVWITFYLSSLALLVSLFTFLNDPEESVSNGNLMRDGERPGLMTRPRYMSVLDGGDTVQVAGTRVENVDGEPGAFLLTDHIMRIRQIEATLPVEIFSDIAVIREPNNAANLRGNARIVSPDGVAVSAENIDVDFDDRSGRAFGRVQSEMPRMRVDADTLDFSWMESEPGLSLVYQGRVRSIYTP